MTTYTKILTVLSFVIIAFNGTSQITKTEVQQFITAHAPSSAQRVFITRKVEYNASANDFAQSDIVFDPASTTMTAMENSLRMKDGKGLDAIISYSAIKYISYLPETEKRYSSICILIE